MAPALSIRNLHRSYRAGIPGCSASVKALSGVELEVGAGEIVAIVGDAGAGKSTLLQCAAGQLRPDRGTITWFGIAAEASQRPPGVVYVPEKSVYYSSLTVREALEYYATVTDVASTRRSSKVSEALRRCALDGETDRRIQSLSTAQLKRVGLAQALLADPRLLLVDGAAADRTPSGERRSLLSDLASGGVSLLLAARDVASVRAVATRVLRLVNGELRAIAGSGVPSTRTLALAVSSPILDYERLSRRIAGVGRDGNHLTVPLRHHSAEEVLSHCRSLGISVQHSRVIVAAASW